MTRAPSTSLLLGALTVACHPRPEATCGPCSAHAAQVETWRAERVAALTDAQGWLALVGLYWLADGEHRLGADASADLVFPPGAPAEIGTLTVRDGQVRLRVADGVDAQVAGQPARELALRSDVDPTQPADRVQLGGRFTFLILARGDRLALRLYDAESPERREFTGIDAFPLDESWRIDARFEPHPSPRTIDQPTVLGTTVRAESPGVATFTHAGQSLRLTPITQHGPHGDELLFVFRDLTSGAETYPGGRFLIAEPPRNGVVHLDFNLAHNPPCAFTPHATCPLPLPENRLQVRVEAGEKTPAGAH